MTSSGLDLETLAVMVIGAAIGFAVVWKILDHFGANRPDQRPGQGGRPNDPQDPPR